MFGQAHEKEEIGKLLGVIVVKLVDNDVVTQREDVLKQGDAIVLGVQAVERIVKDIRVDHKQRSLFAAIRLDLARILQDVM